MEEDDFYLKWEKHHNAFVSVFDSLFKHDILVDCILAAEEKHIKVHRIVLMACSPYFEELLSQHTDNYPIVLLDIKFAELQAIVDFCYRGEVKLPQAELSGFIRAANLLRIKGLCTEKGQRKREGGGAPRSALDSKRQKRGRGSSASADFMENESQVSESAKVPDVALIEGPISQIKSESVSSIIAKMLHDDLDSSQLDQGSDNSDVDTSEDGDTTAGDLSEILAGAGEDGSTNAYLFPWSCNRCGEAFSTRNVYQEHRRGCVDTTQHPWVCHKCPNSYKNKKDLVRHLLYCGKEVPRLVCDRCSSTYKYERGLRRHQKYCGTDMKPLKCMKCEKAYKYKRGLRRHERRCGVYMPSSLQALIKSEAPFSSASLEEGDLEELQCLSPLEEREPWACTCGKSYKYRRSFIKHLGVCRRQVVANELAAEDGDGETSENEEGKKKRKKKKSIDETTENSTPEKVAEKEKSPIVAEKEKSPIVAEKEKNPVVAVKEKSPVVAVKEKSTVVAVKEKSPVVVEKVPEKIPEKTEKEKEADKLLMENLLKLTTKREEPILKGSTIIVTRVEVEEKAD